VVQVEVEVGVLVVVLQELPGKVLPAAKVTEIKVPHKLVAVVAVLGNQAILTLQNRQTVEQD
jgi:hypothetical protein